MRQVIQGEAPFQVLATNFSISPSQEGYTLQISADGNNYTDLFAVGADTTRMVTGVANGSFYRLKGNDSEVTINWQTQCNDGGSGGGGSQYILPPATTNNLGGIKVGEGLAITNDGTLSTSGGSIDSGAVQTLIEANNTKIEEGDIIAGMAKQLYSPDGVTSVGTYAYRTTAGDEDVSTGIANLKKVEGNAIFPETTYNDSAVLNRGGEPVEGFEVEISQGVSSWETFSSTKVNLQYRVKKARYFNLSKSGNNVRIFMNFCSGETTTAYYQLEASYNGTYCSFNGLTGQTWETTVTGGGLTVNVSATGNNLYYEIVDGPTDAYIGYMSPLYGSANMEVKVDIPNDIPVGESTYTYSAADTAWTPSLPQAVTAMTLNSETYVPQDGDEIVINRYLSASGSVVYAQPSKFVALGLNSFDYNCEGVLTTLLAEGKKYSYDTNDGEYRIDTDSNYNTYAIYAVTGLENGYVIHMDGGSFNNKTAGIADTNDAVEIDNADFDTTIENGNLIVYPTTAMPYIILSVPTADVDKVCVHPRWSGYRDNDFEDYAESSLDISAFNTECPLISIGDTRNEWDFVNMKLINKFETSAYSAQAVEDLIEDGKVLGEDFEFDENHIYVAAAEPTEIDITDFDNEYKDNDFSVEYLVDENDVILSIPAKVTTWYMNNLVDKLRRVEIDFIHLDNLNTEGEVGKTYEYDGTLMKWVEGSGYTAEWLKSVADIADGEGTGIIYSNIPDGQKLFEFKYQYGSNWRKVVYSGGTLYLYEQNDTEVTHSSGEFKFITNEYGNIYWIQGIIGKNYIGFFRKGMVSFQNVWDGKANNSHFELIDKYNKPYLGLTGNTTDEGIVRFNKYGQVVKKETSTGRKTMYFNTTGYTSIGFITNGNSNAPERVFVPTTGGNTGQTLVSNGANAAPIWETRIKIVKITSDDYEALVQAGTTDANTLYAIVDE